MSVKPSPRVSVIIPAFNAELLISRTIQSVVDQSVSDWELIVVDDCSTDNTRAVVQAWCDKDSRIKLLALEENFGAPAGPRNKGLHAAVGTWIAFLDADDVWHPKKLQVQLSALEETGAKFCSTLMRDFHNDDDLKISDHNSDKVLLVTFFKQLVKYRTPTSSVIVDASLIRANPFNEDLRYKAREDLDCWVKCHELLGSSIKILSPLVGYRIFNGQISGNKLLMIKRHFFVLRNYKFKSGRRMSLAEALIYTSTHFLLGLLLRRVTGGL